MTRAARDPAWRPLTVAEVWHRDWVWIWQAIGDEAMRRAHPCPDCGIGNWLHKRSCKLADTCCWWCYLPNDSRRHEPWCLGVDCAECGNCSRCGAL